MYVQLAQTSGLTEKEAYLLVLTKDDVSTLQRIVSAVIVFATKYQCTAGPVQQG